MHFDMLQQLSISMEYKHDAHSIANNPLWFKKQPGLHIEKTQRPLLIAATAAGADKQRQIC